MIFAEDTRLAIQEMSRPREVLLLDDDEAFRVLLAREAPKFNCNLLLAANLSDGLSILGSHANLHLVCVDWKLGDGKTARDMILACKAHSPPLPLLCVTGYASSEVFHELERLWPVLILQKPPTLSSEIAAQMLELFGFKRTMSHAQHT